MDFFYTALFINIFFSYCLMSKYRQKLKLQQIFAGLGFGQPTSMIGNGPPVLGNGSHMC